ncbi:MAG: FmdB family zinc ribbon protein [Fidelibacterota bacterium]
MPTYEYRCHSCGHQFEALQGMNDEALKVCPRCRGPVERLIGPGSGLIFRGSGFYVTDYRRKPSSTEESDGSGKKRSDRGSANTGKDTVNDKQGG